MVDARAAADALIDGFGRTTDEIARRLGPSPRRPRVLLPEWLDPPFCSGHWNPEIIERAGGREVVGKAGEASRRITWDEVADARPEVVILSLCGFTVDRAEAELRAFADRPEWRSLAAGCDGRIALVDGSAYFSRPGPRLETSLRIAGAVTVVAIVALNGALIVLTAIGAV